MRAGAFGWIAALWAGAALAQATSEPPGAPIPRERLVEALHALNAAGLGDEVDVGSLFAVPLDELPAVEARIEQLEAELASLGAPDAEGDPARRLQRELARERVRYLEDLAERLREMPEAARRILPEIATERAALRSRSEQSQLLADALGTSAKRFDRLRSRLDAGSLVGFAAAAREASQASASAARALRERVADLERMAGDQAQLAETLEGEGGALRRSFLTSLRAEDREARMEYAFHRHLEEQRRLIRATEDARVQDLAARSAQLIALAEQLPPKRRLGTVAEVEALAEPLAGMLVRVDALIALGPAEQDAWRLAFENEAVTLLSAQVSAAARREAYALSATLWRDARAEAGLAWQRLLEGGRAARREVPDLGALLGSPRGRDWMLRALGAALVFGCWWAVRQATGGLVAQAVRGLSRFAGGRFGLRLGTLVRWSGLVQAVLPVLCAWPALWATQAFLGGEGSALAAFAGAVISPLLWYVLGLQALLGTTRRLAPWRPALIEVSTSLLPRLKRTYARLGAVVAGAAVLRGAARVVIGKGLLATWLDIAVLAWVGVWGAWEAVGWREVLARAWQKALSEPEEGQAPGLERRASQWMERSRWGFALSPVAALRLVLMWLERGIVELSRRTDLAELLEARRLRRAAKQEPETPSDGSELPEEYLCEFPLRPILGEDEAQLLPRTEIVGQIIEQIGRWRDSGGGEGSVVVYGEKGSGKTTLAALVARSVEGAQVVQHTLRGKPSRREELFRALSPSLPVSGAEELGDWIDGLCAGPQRIVLLDEAHNVFLRTEGGFEAYDALVDVVNSTHKQIFWILLFNSFTWRFLGESRSRQHYFRRLLSVPAWSADELRELIRRRNQQTGFEVEFDETLLSGERAGSGGLELVEGAEGYFRLLRETSGGNPRIATRLWLSSLSMAGEKKLRVRTFREPNSDALGRLSDELLFALAAIAQHENLSTRELQRVLNVPEGLARFAVQYLTEAGLVVAKDGSTDRVTLSAPYYRQTLRSLRNKHLLFE